jgi:hypothetical protein
MREVVLGIDVGVPIRAGEQARKTIVVEAKRLRDRVYSIHSSGRNRRLIHGQPSQTDWRKTKRGWTIPELTTNLASDKNVSVAALDIPFSIPQKLLRDPTFAAQLGQEAFETRARFVEFVVSRLTLEFTGPSAAAEMSGLRDFDAWKEPRWWLHRHTDAFLRGAPPLKHVPPNVFNMTLAGVVMVDRLTRDAGYRHALSAESDGTPTLTETYYAGVARVAGITRKTAITEYIPLIRTYLRANGVQIRLARNIQDFLEGYRTSGDDPDGMDAFLCLITAIALREGFAETIPGGADEETIREEGVVLLPRPLAQR